MSNVRPQLNASIPPGLQAFWAAYESEVGKDLSPRFYEAFHFADTEVVANGLSKLVLAGVKRATAGLVWSLEKDGQAVPVPGQLSIVTNWSGQPQCIIETVAVAVVPFREVSAEFASVEGEGDGSLEYWQREHWSYFGRECARIGKEPSRTMLVTCERFKVVHRAIPGAEA